jgi:hypothetical protein
LELLGMQTDASFEVALPAPDVRRTALPDSTEVLARDAHDASTIQKFEQTQSIPKIVEDLRGLTASDTGGEASTEGWQASPSQLTGYWLRWRRRWKLSALVAAWAVTTVFAFTTDTSTFGATEWLVALVGTAALGGGLLGTLVNFAVAAISARPKEPAANTQRFD